MQNVGCNLEEYFNSFFSNNTHINKKLRQGRVADPDPTTRSDAIILKLLWTQFIKVLEATK